MKKFTKSSIICAFISLSLFFAISVSALALQQVSIKQGLFNTIQAGFAESQKGTGSYGTNPNKIVKQCYVRLQEGNYDSGRIYSDTGKKTNGTNYIWTEKLSRINNPFHTCTTNYGWLYY